MIRDADNAPHRRSHQHDSAGGRRRDSDREGPSDADHLRQHTRIDGAQQPGAELGHFEARVDPTEHLTRRNGLPDRNLVDLVDRDREVKQLLCRQYRPSCQQRPPGRRDQEPRCPEQQESNSLSLPDSELTIDPRRH